MRRAQHGLKYHPRSIDVHVVILGGRGHRLAHIGERSKMHHGIDMISNERPVEGQAIPHITFD